VVSRQVTAPVDASLAGALEVHLRLRVQNFGAVTGCAATIAAVMHRE
jgi:hypothetical protein